MTCYFYNCLFFLVSWFMASHLLSRFYFGFSPSFGSTTERAVPVFRTQDYVEQNALNSYPVTNVKATEFCLLACKDCCLSYKQQHFGKQPTCTPLRFVNKMASYGVCKAFVLWKSTSFPGLWERGCLEMCSFA